MAKLSLGLSAPRALLLLRLAAFRAFPNHVAVTDRRKEDGRTSLPIGLAGSPVPADMGDLRRCGTQG